MSNSWQVLVITVVVVMGVMIGGASAMSVISEEEGKELREKIDGENVELKRETEREDRVFLIFAQVQPVQCVTNTTPDTAGTCLTSGDCRSKGGVASGSCASGLGVCCIIIRSCNSETSLNNTYFKHPDAADSTLGACTMTVSRMNTNICQIRLDFDVLEFGQPDPNGDCVHDFFTLSGGLSSVPKVCGSITGQHMYYDLAPNGGAVKVTIDRSLAESLSAGWSIRVTQIACDSKYKAPVGCLQYYTETANVVRSFNFGRTDLTAQNQHLARMDYGVCIKRAESYCSITWTAYKIDGQYSFTLTENTKVVDESLIGTSYTSSRGDQCTTDYVVIPSGRYVTEENGNVPRHADRYCGLGFPDSVTTSSQPFVLYVKTDANETMDKGNRGFSLHYRQMDCF